MFTVLNTIIITAVACQKGFLCHVSFIFIPVLHTQSDSAEVVKNLLPSGLIQHTTGLRKVESQHSLCAPFLSLIFARIQSFNGRLPKWKRLKGTSNAVLRKELNCFSSFMCFVGWSMFLCKSHIKVWCPGLFSSFEHRVCFLGPQRCFSSSILPWFSRETWTQRVVPIVTSKRRPVLLCVRFLSKFLKQGLSSRPYCSWVQNGSRLYRPCFGSPESLYKENTQLSVKNVKCFSLCWSWNVLKSYFQEGSCFNAFCHWRILRNSQISTP